MTTTTESTMNWESITERMTTGTEFGSYVVAESNEKAIIVTKTRSGKQVKVSRKMIAKIADGIANGQTYAKQANGPAGGISYTCAIEATVVAALCLTLNSERRWAQSN